MTSKEFDNMVDAIYSQARSARKFAQGLDNAGEYSASRTWHALADRLFEALEQADNMDNVKIVR